MSKLIEKSKELFLKKINDFGSDPYQLLPHVPEAEKWANFLLKNHPEADKEVVIISIWLHDIGHYPIQRNIDHAITSERIAKEFLLKEKLDNEKINKILHSIRAHRCKDIIPTTIEAKIVACSDSASHMTGAIYFDMIKNKNIDDALSKLERDFKDVSIFPEVKDKLKEIYPAWKQLINSFSNFEI